MPTPAGLIDHVTVVLASPVTVAVNCRVPPCVNVAVVGEIRTGGLSVTVAVADLVVSATLVALTVTVCCADTVAGAVYSPPLLTVPTPAGLIDHVTAVLARSVTVAVNCCVPPCPNVTVVGDMVTVPGGFKVTVALADLVVSATLVTLTVTVCWLVNVAGAV